MCVGMMEGFNKKRDCSSEDMATWLFAYEDELDIVGKAIMDNSAEKDHLQGPSFFIPFCPIVECVGLSRALWVNLEVILINDRGVAVTEGTCYNTHP